MEDPVQANLEQQSVPESVAPLGISDAFIGILTEPSVTYDVVGKTAPRTSYWLIPTLVCAVFLAAALAYRFSTPEMKDIMRQQQQERLDALVKDGKITQEQAAQSIEQMEQFSGIITVTAPISGGLMMFVYVLVFALVVWLLGRYAFKIPMRYGAVLAVVGLTMYIVGIDQLLALLLGLLTQNPFANLSPALLMQADLKSMAYRAAMQADPVAFWSYVVMAVGLQRGLGMTRGQAYGTAFGLWAVMVSLAVFWGVGV